LRGTFHGVSPKHLQRYLHEFVFRFNQRWHENELFSRVLLCAISAGPSPYNQLTAESEVQGRAVVTATPWDRRRGGHRSSTTELDLKFGVQLESAIHAV
ncbi:MAG: transposase, partial [Deltaproteobacteria bacterium]|nr:transposase [Deltaproteobacteria bacterium]